MLTATTDVISHPAFWKQSFEEHGGAVLAFLRSRTGQRELAEDLLQETFVRAIRSAALRDRHKARAYLLSVAHRLLIDHLRRKRPVLFSEMSDEAAPLEVAAEGHGSPEERLDEERIGERLEAELAKLPEALRITFQAAVFEQRPYDEIAAENGWSTARVRLNLHRARKRVIANLRDLLAVDPGDSP